jgi:para-aminobenzoate synthetase/4-amino-4-deoxychorismate lyase
MIVDLMRNDLSRVCRAGTVRVAELCRAYRFPTVHQMTSTVQGELKANVTAYDIFRAAFPPGSVTGAPKVRATEIICDLEPEPRGIYCGSIGLFYPNGDFDCNVAIRTLESNYHSSKSLAEETKESSSVHPSSRIPHPFLLGLGSGIVIDSDPPSEWRETLVKSKFARQQPQEFGLFETFRYIPDLSMARRAGLSSGGSRTQVNSDSRNPAGIFHNLHSHLRRLKHSCDYFSRPFPLRKILLTLRNLKLTLGDKPHRVRLELRDEEIALRLIDEHLSWPDEGINLLISETRLDPDDPRLYHKTTDRREKYEALQIAQSRGAHEVLFRNTRGELCEGAISNILLKIDGHWLTPALASGLLPGVWRGQQLKSGRCREAILTLDDLSRADEILMGNSVRGEGRVINILADKLDSQTNAAK